jgi:hypothetical protein
MTARTARSSATADLVLPRPWPGACGDTDKTSTMTIKLRRIKASCRV